MTYSKSLAAGVENLMKTAWNEYYNDVVHGRVDISHPRALKAKMVAINTRSSLRITSTGTDVVQDTDGGMYL